MTFTDDVTDCDTLATGAASGATSGVDAVVRPALVTAAAVLKLAGVGKLTISAGKTRRTPAGVGRRRLPLATACREKKREEGENSVMGRNFTFIIRVDYHKGWRLR